jgi:hypothetical protein
MKRRTHFISSFIILLGIGLYFLNRRPVSIPQERAEEQVIRKKPVQERVQETIKNPTRSISSITKKDLQALRKAYPFSENVKAEAEQMPHKTPESIVKFSRSLGPLYEKALQNESDASMLLRELETCTLNDSVIQSVRALCLSKADQLAHVYPGMQNEVEDLRAKAPEDVNKLLQKKAHLLKK